MYSLESDQTHSRSKPESLVTAMQVLFRREKAKKESKLCTEKLDFRHRDVDSEQY